MRAIECPNCYSRVFLGHDGSCPACHKDPSAPTADASKTRIAIWEGQVLPAICFGCGNQTDSLLLVKRSSSSPAFQFLKVILNLVLFPLKLVTFGLRGLLSGEQGRETYQSLKMRIPFCLKCRGANEMPRIVWTDFQEGTISFIVPKVVAEHLRKS